MAQLVALLLALFNILSVYLSHEESKVVVNTRQLQEKKVWNRDRSGGHSRRGASTAAASHRYPAHSNGLVTSGQVNHRPREMRKDSYVIATLVTETNAKYRNALRLFILSLRRIAKYKGTIVIVIAKNLELKIEEEYMKNVLIQPVDLLEVAIGGHLGLNRHYSKLLTKLQLWNLHYEHVVYYDSDVIFLKNPVPGIKRECPKDKKICAVLDEGAKLYFNKDNYMNAGFLVIRPNKVAYSLTHLLTHSLTHSFVPGRLSILNEESATC